MTNELYILSITAASIGFLHTILGPDHYIPFIMMSKAGKWSLTKTLWVTILSGVGHVLSSIVIGAIGVGAGIAITGLEAVESTRGEIAAWLLITFGLLYFLWGLKKAFKNKKHSHWHSHSGDIVHSHSHSHMKEHAHVHNQEEKANLTPWILFTIFVFGPCEALIPVLMYPAANIGITGIIVVVIIFALTTITTMLSIVLVSLYGISFVPLKRMEKYTHALAGAVILLSGVAVQFFGL